MELRDYQKYGVARIKEAGSLLIGDSPGVGKTAQAIMATADCPKVLVLTMATLKYQFADQVSKWLPASRVVVINGKPATREAQWHTNCQYYVANYELLLQTDWGLMLETEWDYIIADECTRLSNHTNKQYRALKALHYKHILPMTGTAISNSPLDAYGVFELVKPGLFGNYYKFVNTYIVRVYNEYLGFFQNKGFKNLSRLHETIEPYYIRRTKEQVLTELPPKVSTVIPVKLSAKERKLYDQIKQSLLFEIEKSDVGKIGNLVNIMSGAQNILRLRQLTNSMELIGEGKESSKLESLKDLLRSLELL